MFTFFKKSFFLIILNFSFVILLQIIFIIVIKNSLLNFIFHLFLIFYPIIFFFKFETFFLNLLKKFSVNIFFWFFTEKYYHNFFIIIKKLLNFINVNFLFQKVKNKNQERLTETIELTLDYFPPYTVVAVQLALTFRELLIKKKDSDIIMVGLIVKSYRYDKHSIKNHITSALIWTPLKDILLVDSFLNILYNFSEKYKEDLSTKHFVVETIKLKITLNSTNLENYKNLFFTPKSTHNNLSVLKYPFWLTFITNHKNTIKTFPNSLIFKLLKKLNYITLYVDPDNNTYFFSKPFFYSSNTILYLFKINDDLYK